MIDNFKQDISELKKEIEEAYLLLEAQTYIQRNGEVYGALLMKKETLKKH